MISPCGAMVMLEFSTSIPRSGETSASNAITASAYLLKTSGADSTIWKLRGLAIAAVAFAGYDNVNAVLSEVNNPQRTLRIALPTAMGTVTVLYILANIAYLAGVSRAEFLSSGLTIAASLFNNVFGHSAAVKALPALVAISAIGHLLGVAFTVRMHIPQKQILLIIPIILESKIWQRKFSKN
ncbi:hypothetical protein PoHVEF18_002193 [Penicillium ochrochloron]